MNQTPNMTASNLDTTWNLTYYLRDTSRSLTGLSINRDVNDETLSVYGGSVAPPMGGHIQLYGGTNPALSGGMAFRVGDAIGNGLSVMWIEGRTDTPFLSMNSHRIRDLLDPIAAQDAVTLNYLTTHGAGAMINDSYYLRDNSLPLTSEKVKRNVDNDLLSLYGGDAIAGGTGIISLFGKTSMNPNAVEVVVGDAAGTGNIMLTGWKGGDAPRMYMNSYNISGIKTITADSDAVNKSYVDDQIATVSPEASLLSADGHIQSNRTAILSAELTNNTAGQAAAIRTADDHISTNSSAGVSYSTLRLADDHILSNLTVADEHIATNVSMVWNNLSAINTTMRNNVSMNFAPLVAGKVPTVNLGGAGAGAGNYLRGDQTWSAVVAGAPDRTSAVILSSDFYTPNIYAIPGLLGVLTGSGTIVATTTDKEHPGVVTLTDSATAPAGVYYGCVVTGNWLLGGGEHFETVFKMPANGYTPIDIRLGWADTIVGTTRPVDGVYFNITNSSLVNLRNLTGETAVSSVYKPTTTKYTYAPNTWYRGTIDLNAAGTLATFTLYDAAGAQLWTDTQATLPTAAGRETSPCLIAMESTTSATSNLITLDYVQWSINRVLVR